MVVKNHTNDLSTYSEVSNVDLILTLGLLGLNPSGKMMNGTEHVVLFNTGLNRLTRSDSFTNSW